MDNDGDLDIAVNSAVGDRVYRNDGENNFSRLWEEERFSLGKSYKTVCVGLYEKWLC